MVYTVMLMLNSPGQDGGGAGSAAGEVRGAVSGRLVAVRCLEDFSLHYEYIRPCAVEYTHNAVRCGEQRP